MKMGCSYVGFEIDNEHVIASNERLERIKFAVTDQPPLLDLGLENGESKSYIRTNPRSGEVSERLQFELPLKKAISG